MLKIQVIVPVCSPSAFGPHAFLIYPNFYIPPPRYPLNDSDKLGAVRRFLKSGGPEKYIFCKSLRDKLVADHEVTNDELLELFLGL